MKECFHGHVCSMQIEQLILKCNVLTRNVCLVYAVCLFTCIKTGFCWIIIRYLFLVYTYCVFIVLHIYTVYVIDINVSVYSDFTCTGFLVLSSCFTSLYKLWWTNYCMMIEIENNYEINLAC